MFGGPRVDLHLPGRSMSMGGVGISQESTMCDWSKRPQRKADRFPAFWNPNIPPQPDR